MKAIYSKDDKGKNILQIRPETDFERDFLLTFADKGSYQLYGDVDVNLVIREE